MMMWDRKKAMQSILEKRKAGGGEVIAGPVPMNTEVVKTDDGEIDGRHLAAQDVMAALHDKSADKLMQALGNFVDLHAAKAEAAEDEAEPNDE